MDGQLGKGVNSCGCLRGLLCHLTYKEQPGRMFTAAKARAKRDHIPFTLIPSDIVVPEKCPILGITLTKGKGQGGHCDTSPSLDQIIPGAGYTKENIQVISNRANVLKGNGTAEEHFKIARHIEGFSSGKI